MNDRPLVILASARKNSDTALFVDTVFKDMRVDKIDLLDYKITTFDYSSAYPHYDEFKAVVDCILKHRIVVFATPVYWYAMSGLLKVFFDRFTDLVTVDKKTGRLLEGKSTFLIAVGADKEMPEGFEVPFQLTSNYLNLSYGGAIYHSTKWKKTDCALKAELDLIRGKIGKHYS